MKIPVKMLRASVKNQWEAFPPTAKEISSVIHETPIRTERLRITLSLNHLTDYLTSKQQLEFHIVILLFGLVVATVCKRAVDTCTVKKEKGHGEEKHVAQDQKGHRAVKIGHKGSILCIIT